MQYRAQFSQRHDTTHDATQSAVLREDVSSLLQPAIKLPSSGTHLCGTFLPATPSLNAKAVIHALRAKPRKTSLLRGECTDRAPQGASPIFRACHPIGQIAAGDPVCACADLRFASPFPFRLRLLSKGGETPPLAPCYPRLRQVAFGM